MLYGVILAGGMGKRLWPESNRSTPKPFLCRRKGLSLLEETIERTVGIIPPHQILISTSQIFAGPISRFIRYQGIEILSEPVSRNTAAAIALAALHIEAQNPEAIMAVFPSDAFIGNPQELHTMINAAVRLIEEQEDRLITIGIHPKRPETGYGYIKAVTPLETRTKTGDLIFPPLKSDFFCEKPDLASAKEYLLDGNYYWNTGIFIWKAANILDLISRYLPEMAPLLSRRRSPSHNLPENFRQLFDSLTSIPIDKAVLEKVSLDKKPEIVLLPAPFAWSDLGTFEELTVLGNYGLDSFGNRTVGAKTTAVDSTNNIVRISLSHPIKVALAGLKDLLIVLHHGTLLIVPQKRAKLIQELSECQSEITSGNDVFPSSIRLRSINASNNVFLQKTSFDQESAFTVALGDVSNLLAILDDEHLFVLAREQEHLLPELKKQMVSSPD